MKKPYLFLFTALFLPASCSPRTRAANVASFNSPYVIPFGDMEGRVKALSSDAVVSPFNTSITANLYYYEGDDIENQLDSIKQEFEFKLEYYHALSDRHYDYSLDGEKINNVKVINESYGTETPIKVDPFLFDLLKTSYTFTLNSQGKFNMFLGSLNDIYETKLNDIKDPDSTSPFFLSDGILTRTTGMTFARFSEEEKDEIESYAKGIPTTQEELKDILTFDEENKTVTFHEYKDVKNLSISLGGNAKGYATERISDEFEEEYPSLSLILNSGTSSIKAIGTRPDKKSWTIRYINPAYQERNTVSTTGYNDYEIYLNVDGGFNLSTSGYYENYFYEYDKGDFLRRNHIIDPSTGYSHSYFDQVSVFLNDAGLADMYTTSLMNCDSIQEAENLFSSLNEIYNQKDAGMILCLKEDSNRNHFSYSMSDYTPVSENNLPIVTLSDGTRYEGDYSGLDWTRIASYDTTLQSGFSQAYYFSKGLYPSAHLMNEKELTYPDSMISKIYSL